MGLLFLLVGLVMAGGAAFFFVRNANKAKAAAAWPTVDGVITGSSVSHRRERDASDRLEDVYTVAVAYRYAVEGRELQGERIGYGATTRFSNQKARAEALAARYPEGAKVQVRYDPANPAEACLETAPPSMFVPIVFGGVGAVFVVIGILMAGAGV